MKTSTTVLLLTLAGVLFAAWFFSSYEKVVRQEYVGFQGEARVNRFLAAELLLGELGVEADGRPSLEPSDWLPEHDDSLVLQISAAIAVDEERAILLDWVENGGHLLVLPPDEKSRLTDDFLAYLGMRFVEALPRQEDDDTEAQEASAEREDEESYDYVVDLDFTRLRVEALEDGAIDASISDDQGIVVARRQWGAGYVTVISNTDFFTNASLELYNHARLLLDVIDGYLEPGVVWFIYDASFPALWELIWAGAPYAVIAFALTVLLWLWSISPKFGPPIAPASTERRSIIEHVQAAGHFAWRQHGGKALAESSAAALISESELRHPGVGRLSADAQAKQLARITGLPAQHILDVLVNQQEMRHREFTHNMQAIQNIRKEL